MMQPTNGLKNGRESFITGPVTYLLLKQRSIQTKANQKNSSIALRSNSHDLVIVLVQAAKEKICVISHGRGVVVFPAVYWQYWHCRKRGNCYQTKKITTSFSIV